MGRLRTALNTAREHYHLIMDGIAACERRMSIEAYRESVRSSNEEWKALWSSMGPIKKGLFIAGAVTLIGAMATCVANVPPNPDLEQLLEMTSQHH